MKKVLFIVLMLFSITITAQNKPFQFGFKAGPNVGWYTTSADDYANDGINFGGLWGFIADIFIMENYSFTTGFDVLYLNGTMTYPSVYQEENSSIIQTGNLKRKFKTKYVKLPFIFTMKTNQIKKLRYYGQIGFGLSILLTAKADDKFTPDGSGSVIDDDHNIYDELRFTRESLILGAGAEVPLQGSTYVRIGLVFDNAFVNIIKGNNTVNTSDKNNGRNSFLAAEVSLLF